MFTQSFDSTNTIIISNEGATVFGQSKDYLTNYNSAATVKKLPILQINARTARLNGRNEVVALQTASDKKLTQDFYDQAISSFIQTGDTLVTEQGTSFSGLVPFTMLRGTQFIGQPLWGSIGYAFPAALGSQIADEDHRTILSTSEG
ncbi:hypothetical protein [Nicoliella lavandulae]|uniref:Uncharacterized protein n=1 Tax=Nicoliella lavandulae TaxID=3082954 RepID=A0ABU8SLV0_9LACO